MNLSALPSREMMPGLHGKMVHGEQLTWAFWTVEEGAEVPEHQHHNEQIMHIVEGEFSFSLDGVTKTYTAGDVDVIPSHIPHSGKALSSCKIMDVFCPVREDYK